MSNLFRELRLAVRVRMRRPLATVATIAILSLAIAAATAMFAVVHAVLLQPLPFRGPESLVWLHGSWSGGQHERVSQPDFADYRDRLQGIDHLAAISGFVVPLDLATADGAYRVEGRYASAGLLETLGLAPLLGRELNRAEERDDAEAVVVVGEETWRRHFGADPEVVGRGVMLDGVERRIVGVAPRELRLLGPTDVLIPARFDRPELRQVRLLDIVGRLADGGSVGEAAGEVVEVADRLAAEHPSTNSGWSAQVVPLRTQLLGDHLPTLQLFVFAVAAMLVLGWVNASGLELTRAMARRREMALRTALGASSRKLARQAAIESGIVAGASGLLGWGLAGLLLPAIHLLPAADLPRLQQSAVGPRELLVALAVTGLTMVLLALVPLVGHRRDRCEELLRGGTRGSTGELRARRGGMALQVALTVLLLLMATSLVGSLWSLSRVAPGFDLDPGLVARLRLPQSGYPDADARLAFWDELLPALESLPGARAASLTTELPLSGQGNAAAFTAWIPGGEPRSVDIRSTSTDYLPDLGVPLRRGRHFAPADGPDGAPVVIVNESLARAFFPGEDPLGRSLVFDFAGEPTTATVVGLVGDLRHVDLGSRPGREAYFPLAQTPLGTYSLLLRAHDEPLSLTGPVRAGLEELDPALALGDVGTLQGHVDASLAAPRLRTVLVASFAGVSLLLTVVGLYGVLSQSVQAKLPELGVRMALGASSRRVVAGVLRDAAAIAGAGGVLGLAAGVVASGLLRDLVYGVRPFEPKFAFVTLALVCACALVASAGPARRAARSDPVQILRRL